MIMDEINYQEIYENKQEEVEEFEIVLIKEKYILIQDINKVNIRVDITSLEPQEYKVKEKIYKKKGNYGYGK